MNPAQMELQDIYRLQAFVTVVDEGSLTAAVEKLHITQPALSSRLKLLEESLNCTLLERTGRGVRPTYVGMLVYKQAREILNSMHNLNLVVQNNLTLREGFVHLCGGTTAVAGIYPNLIKTFSELHPNIQFTLQELDVIPSLQAVRFASADIAVVSAPLELDTSLFDGLKVCATIEERVYPIAAYNHPLAEASRHLAQLGKKLLPMHISRQNMILPEEGSVLRNLIDEEFRRLRIVPKITMTLRSRHGIIQLVERGIGISVASMLSLCPCNKITVLPVDNLKIVHKILVVVSAERTLPPAAQEFLKLLLSFAEERNAQNLEK